MRSYKVVFFLPPDVVGSHIVKELFQDKFKLSIRNDENLAFDYIPYKVDPISVEWKLYLVSDIEKFEKLRPLYFTNVAAFAMVMDSAKRAHEAWKKIVADLEFHGSKCAMVCLVYKKVDDLDKPMEACCSVQMCRELYFTFSERSDVERIICHLLEQEDGLQQEILSKIE